MSLSIDAVNLAAATAVTNALKEARRQSRGESRGGSRPTMKTDAITQTDPEPESEPQVASTQVEPESGNSCSICLDQRDGLETANTTITSCGHLFCTSCLLKHLAVRNTCPICRNEIEPARLPPIEPLTANTVATIIQEEENIIDMTRRIAVIGVFPDSQGRAAMILSLARELAFGSAHSIAGWQGTDDAAYHASWTEFEYTVPPEDDEDEEDDEDDEDDEGDSDSDSELGDGNGNGESDDDDKCENDCCGGGVGAQILHRPSTPAPVSVAQIAVAPALQRRAVFQSPVFQSHTTSNTHNPWMVSTTEFLVRAAIVILVVYYEYSRL